MTPATPIKTILQHKSHDDTVEAFEGTITEVFKRRTGTGQHGDWSFQDARMHDTSGDTIDVTFAGMEDMHPEKGKTLRITSTANSRGKINGVKVDDSEYQGKTTRKLKITGTATFSDMQNSRPVSDLKQAVNDRLQQDAPAPASRPAASQAQEKTQDREFLLNVKKRALRLAGMHGVCYDAAVHSALQIIDRHGYAMVPTAVGILADKIFMECVRRTDPDLMPLDPWAGGFKGQPLTILIDELNRQVLDHADAKSQAMSERTQKHQAAATTATAAFERWAAIPAAPAPPVDAAPDDDRVPF